jgi:hypothetical protein
MQYVGVPAGDGSSIGTVLNILNESLFRISNDGTVSTLVSRQLGVRGRFMPHDTPR